MKSNSIVVVSAIDIASVIPNKLVFIPCLPVMEGNVTVVTTEKGTSELAYLFTPVVLVYILEFPVFLRHLTALV